MAAWTASELNAIGTAGELRVAGRRADGRLRKLVIVWHVRVGDDLFIRSVYGADGKWYQGTQDQHVGRIESGGVGKDVAFTRDSSRDAEIDAAYRAKYGSGSSVQYITAPAATATTLRLVPQD